MITYHYKYADAVLQGWKLPNEEDVSLWLMETAERHDRAIGQFNFLFSDDEFVLYLNQKYLKHDYYTDILTFDLTDPGESSLLTAEIYISVERVQENAKEFKANFVDELHRVMVHGLLHCIGFRDETDHEEYEMRHEEDKALALRMF
jgi:probable rRNA maturation factor